MIKRKIKLVMPMAGDGKRFADVGYDFPKPMIPIDGVPMFAHAERQIGIDFDERIFIVRREHDLSRAITNLYPDAIVIEIDEKTEGTACTLLLAQEHFADGSSMFVSNCDQYIEWDSTIAQIKMSQPNVDALIATFESPDLDPKWSYVQSFNGRISRVAEKEAISSSATCGWYFWKDGGMFIDSALAMIAANDRVNGEFYTCPVFNYSIDLGAKVIPYNVSVMQGLGTPEDLKCWLNAR
jgi:NDP-sugar pyrophosphorylase family protein